MFESTYQVFGGAAFAFMISTLLGTIIRNPQMNLALCMLHIVLLLIFAACILYGFLIYPLTTSIGLILMIIYLYMISAKIGV